MPWADSVPLDTKAESSILPPGLPKPEYSLCCHLKQITLHYISRPLNNPASTNYTCPWFNSATCETVPAKHRRRVICSCLWFVTSIFQSTSSRFEFTAVSSSPSKNSSMKDNTCWTIKTKFFGHLHFLNL